MGPLLYVWGCGLGGVSQVSPEVSLVCLVQSVRGVLVVGGRRVLQNCWVRCGAILPPLLVQPLVLVLLRLLLLLRSITNISETH